MRYTIKDLCTLVENKNEKLAELGFVERLHIGQHSGKIWIEVESVQDTSSIMYCSGGGTAKDCKELVYKETVKFYQRRLQKLEYK